MIPTDFQTECARKLEAITPYLQGDGFEKNTSLLNMMLRRTANLWLLVEPTSGSVIQGAVLASDLLDDLLGRLSQASQEDINRVFHEVIKSHEQRLSETAKRLDLLTPRVGLALDMTGHWSMKGSHGLSCLRVASRYEIGLMFIQPLTNPELYIAHCNVAGALLNVSTSEVTVKLPKEFDPSIGLVKVILQRVTEF